MNGVRVSRLIPIGRSSGNDACTHCLMNEVGLKTHEVDMQWHNVKWLI